jgi:hypothetical protein
LKNIYLLESAIRRVLFIPPKGASRRLLRYNTKSQRAPWVTSSASCGSTGSTIKMSSRNKSILDIRLQKDQGRSQYEQPANPPPRDLIGCGGGVHADQYSKAPTSGADPSNEIVIPLAMLEVPASIAGLPDRRRTSSVAEFTNMGSMPVRLFD